MSALVTDPNFEDPDRFYAALLAANEGRSLEDSHAFMRAFALILANHVGSRAALEEALDLAAASLDPADPT